MDKINFIILCLIIFLAFAGIVVFSAPKNTSILGFSIINNNVTGEVAQNQSSNTPIVLSIFLIGIIFPIVLLLIKGLSYLKKYKIILPPKIPAITSS